MLWPRIDWKIWFLLVCFYREEIKFGAKKHLLSSRTQLMSWKREEKNKVPVRVNSEEVNENPVWEPKRNTRQMANHPSKHLGYFPVWIHWCDLRNELSLICAVSFAGMLWQRLSPRGSKGISISRDAAGQGQCLLPQGTSAFLPGHTQSHRALMACGTPCPG